MVDHNVMRLHVAVHDAFAVAVIEGLEELEDVVPNIDVVELGVEAPEIGVVDILEDKRRRLALEGGVCQQKGWWEGAYGDALESPEQRRGGQQRWDHRRGSGGS